MTCVITDVKYRMSLSLIRDLGERGVNIIACQGEDALPPVGAASKYVKRFHALPSIESEPQGYLDGLFGICQALCRDGERPSLLPVGAKTLALLCAPEVRARFEEVCGMCLPSADALETSNDKRCVASLARHLEIPVPREYDISEGAEHVSFPCVVKPECGERFGIPAEKRYIIARDIPGLEKAVSHFLSLTGSVPIVQQYIGGRSVGLSVLAQKGVIVNYICHERVREYPLSGGPSTCCRCLSGDRLYPYAKKIIAALRFSGFAMLEFKLDMQGRPFLLEINPRLWGTFPLTRAAKSSLSYDWLALSSGLEPECTPPKTGTKMYYLPSDLRPALAMLKRGSFGAFLSAVRDWLSPSVKDGILDFSDPGGTKAYISSLFERR